MPDDTATLILLRKISEGNETAFRKLFDIYYQRLFHLALYYLKSKEQAEEAVSDVFFILWKRKDSLSGIDAPGKYLYTSVKNRALHYIRRSPRHEYEASGLYTIESMPDAEDPESRLFDAEYRELVQQAIDSLPGKCKEVFRLVLSDKLKNKEIATLLDISIKTVEAHITSANKRIAQYVNDLYNSHKTE